MGNGKGRERYPSALQCLTPTASTEMAARQRARMVVAWNFMLIVDDSWLGSVGLAQFFDEV